ncbi:hypothetical protein BH11BAC2_BH11BAC2_17300 [soil metagenome]
MRISFKLTSKSLSALMLVLALVSCSHVIRKNIQTIKPAPDHFKARFETSKGDFEIEATREWSPKAVDRLYELIKHGFYDHIIIYRVVPNYVAQFAPTDTSILNAWTPFKVPDEPVLKANTMGTVAFARGGIETRGADLFINLKNNSPRLDTLNYSGVKGFPVIAVVTKGMDVVSAFYSGYGDVVLKSIDSLKSGQKAFLNSNFPQLDSIRKAYIIIP